MSVIPPTDSVFENGYFQKAVEFFGPGLDYNNPLPEHAHRRSFKVKDNIVGHQQRAFSLFWGINVCGRLGKVGLDIGSAGLPAPYCVGLDFYCGQHHPVYGGEYIGAHFVGNGEDLTPHIIQAQQMGDDGKMRTGLYSPWPPQACKDALSPFPDRSFPLVIGNHVAEHIEGDFAEVLDKHWLRVLIPNGYLCLVIPDHQYHDVYRLDRDHVHAWTPAAFGEQVLSKLLHKIRVLEFDTMKNDFAFNVVLQKAA